MNKAILPSILAVTILIAGLFALAPIENASTVHGTIQASQLNQIVITTSSDLQTQVTPDCDDNVYRVYYVVRGDDEDTFSISLFVGIGTLELVGGTFEASGGAAGAGINMATGMVSFDPSEVNLFSGNADTVEGIFTIVGQSDDTCDFS